MFHRTKFYKDNKFKIKKSNLREKSGKFFRFQSQKTEFKFN